MNEKAYFQMLAEDIKQYRLSDKENVQVERRVYNMYKEAGYDLKKAEDFNEKCLNLAVKPNSEELSAVVMSVSKKNWYNLLHSADMTELIENPDKFTPKQKSILQLYFYLHIVEGAMTEYIEFIAFLLVKNGHDIYDPRRMQFVKTFEDIENIDLYVKEQFLEAHGFGFITLPLDRALRNCIAHQNFVIAENGQIKNLKTQNIIDISKKIDEVLLVCTIISITILRVYDIIFPETDRKLLGGSNEL
jgi:hypothetical protein